MPQVNRTPPNRTHDQTLWFDVKKWTEQKARTWLREHDYITRGYHKTDKYHQFRQYDMNDNKYKYRRDSRGQGIVAIIGIPRD